ncbi:unnamed protein product [Acanthoscelides obtectus]|uniref:CHK kinase-like domain-containing protein n=1 Tax=Acanthoscelides obtectus TaxID=200917 RepID=A0A9P0M614_ACAOB|nr:unnamed protein product [Acanthoscelides obtectus]CAK1660961.1 hypothetical protein AOBTE_LOCUS22367 [Acanthoscelides obtectus]
MSISDKFLKSHSVLCDSELDDSFIDKSKYQYVVDKMPTVELTKLSKDEFNDGILKLAEFDVSKIGNKSCGTIFHVDKESLKIPAVYDVLCEILLHVDTDERLRAFSDITENYYNKTLSKYDLTKDQFSTQLRLFLPYAKFERLYHSCKKENIDDIQKSALEVEECIQYPVLYREECYAILKHIYKTKEAELISFEAVPAQDLPGNLGKYYKIKLTARNGTETETHRLFAKIVDKDNPDLREFSMVPFGKEQFFFETLLKKCEELGLEELTDVCPKCYFAGNDKLLFEDLSVDGYSSWNFHIPVSYNWLETTVKKLAKLHAMSIIFEEKLSEKTGKIVRLDEEFSEGVAEAAFLDREDIRSFRESYKKCVGEYILPRCLGESEGGRLDTLKEKIYEASDRIYVLVQKSDKIRNVYSHGDMWGDVGIISERRFVIGKFVITVVLPFCQTSYPARRHPAPSVSQRHVQRRSSNSNFLCVPHRLPADKVLFSISRPYVPSLRQYRPYLKTKTCQGSDRSVLQGIN